MRTEKELNSKILEITMLIRDKYPELSKYLQEMPVTIPDVKIPEMNLKVLEEYVSSLQEMLKKYAPNHKISK